MHEIAKVIGRIIILLINKGIITKEEALWVTETKTEELSNDLRKNLKTENDNRRDA